MGDTAGLANILGRTMTRSEIALGSGGVASVGRRSTLGLALSLRLAVLSVFASVSGFVANVGIAQTLFLAARLIGTVPRSSYIASVSGLVANVGRGQALGSTVSQWDTLTGGTAGDTLVVSRITNVTVASLVLVIPRTDPLLEPRRRVVGVMRLSGAVRSLCSVFISYVGRAPTTAFMF